MHVSISSFSMQAVFGMDQGSPVSGKTSSKWFVYSLHTVVEGLLPIAHSRDVHPCELLTATCTVSRSVVIWDSAQEDAPKLRYATAKDYLDYIKYRKQVHFKRLEQPKVRAA